MIAAFVVPQEKPKKKYIDLDVAINAVYEAYADGKSAYDALESIPPADVVPVVLCCDCKHFQINVSPSGYLPQGVPEWECRHWLRPTDPTDFCSYGSKREES